ncbi:MAG TPA: M56 family peptidase [Firmicutes bacterium]|nr:M56 family peptidase [Bacillota bacterium]
MNEFIILLNSIAHQWLKLLTLHMFQASLFILILMIFLKILHNKNSLYLYILSLLGLIKLMIPPIFINRAPGIPKAVNTPLVFMMNRGYETATPAVNLSVSAIFFLAWLMLILFLLIRLTVSIITYKRSLTCTQWTTGTQRSNSIARKYGIKRQIQACTLRHRYSIFTSGTITPVIYLPEEARQWEDNQLDAILTHEIAHIKHYDIFFIYCQNIMQTLFFFNPAVWVLNGVINNFRERKCDDLALTASEDFNAIQSYRSFLFDILEKAVQSNSINTCTSLFGNKWWLYRRLKYLSIKKEVFMKKVSIFQVIIMVVLSVFVVTASITASPMEQTGTTSEETDSSIPPEDSFIHYSKAPVVITRQAPEYPEKAKKKKLEGKVSLKIFISKEGLVLKAVPVKSPHKILTDAAIKAAKKTTFEPAENNGEPVGVWYGLKYNFTLK